MLAGCQRLDGALPWATAYYGSLSEVSFALRTLELFDQGAYSPEQSLTVLSGMFNKPVPPVALVPSGSISLQQPSTSLSERNTAIRMVESLFSSSHPFAAFLGRSATRDIIEAVHNPTNVVHLHNHTPSFALYHSVLALAYVMHCKAQGHQSCAEIMDMAWNHFREGQSLLNQWSCDDVLSLQALLCLMVFLISTSCMRSAHGLLSIMYSTLIRLGFHGDESTGQSKSPHDTLRVMIFSTAIKIDLYISLILDIPRLIADEHVRRCIDTLHRLPEHDTNLSVLASTKQLEMLHFTHTARQSVFGQSGSGSDTDLIDAEKLSNLEQDLRRWTGELSSLVLQIGEQAEYAM